MPKSFDISYVRQGSEPKPFILITIRRQGREYTARFLVDSGADYSIINAEFAEILGIPLERLPTRDVRGIGGVVRLSSLPLSFEIPGSGFSFEATTFFGRDYRGGVNLLGRKPLFSLCKVTFDDNGQKLSLLGHD